MADVKGQHMAAEIAEATQVFCATARSSWPGVSSLLRPGETRAIYTVARGSSDAAANILSYELMRELRVPVTSLPPSVFSIGDSVDLSGTTVLIVSQSGGSEDLVQSARAARASGAQVIAITNAPGSPVEAEAHLTLPIGAGPELAVPATKSVIGSLAAGVALLSAVKPDYKARAADAVAEFAEFSPSRFRPEDLRALLLRSQSLYVIGRDTGYGAALETALKVKETCAIHAEAYSASEVLHGPIQLASKGLSVLILDEGSPRTRPSLDAAEARFRTAGCDVLRLSPANLGATRQVPVSSAALLLRMCYPAILDAALALGIDPDRPSALEKVTQTL